MASFDSVVYELTDSEILSMILVSVLVASRHTETVLSAKPRKIVGLWYLFHTPPALSPSVLAQMWKWHKTSQ